MHPQACFSISLATSLLGSASAARSARSSLWRRPPLAPDADPRFLFDILQGLQISSIVGPEMADVSFLQCSVNRGRALGVGGHGYW
jgi:hypothetical protein